MSKVEMITQNNAKKIVLNGHFTAMDHDQFRAILEDLKSAEGPLSCAVDLENLDFIDSGGLGMLLLLRDVCMKQKMALSLNNAKGDVMRILDIAKFDQLFKVGGSE
jgi:stage II sporulation protein AA (anti-sigma F factor antagonist)